MAKTYEIMQSSTHGKMIVITHTPRETFLLLDNAEALLSNLEQVIAYIDVVGLIPPCVRDARKIIKQARGE